MKNEVSGAVGIILVAVVLVSLAFHYGRSSQRNTATVSVGDADITIEGEAVGRAKDAVNDAKDATANAAERAGQAIENAGDAVRRAGEDVAAEIR